MIPVALSLKGLGFEPPTILFLGWFGPRGIASILFALLILEESGITHVNEIFTIIMITVLFSVFAHGLSSYPVSELYAGKFEKLKDIQEEMAEHQTVKETPTRI